MAGVLVLLCGGEGAETMNKASIPKNPQVKVWVWENKVSGKYAETSHGSGVIENAPTRKAAEMRGVDNYRWRLRRVVITPISRRS